MRQLYIAFIMIVLLASGSALAQAAPPAPADTVEDLGRGVFAALQSGSFEAMEHLLPAAEDIMDLAEEEEGQGEPLDPEQVEEMIAGIRDHAAADFANLLEEIDWPSATMKGVRIRSRGIVGDEGREIDEATLVAEQRSQAWVQVLFETGGHPREIELGNCNKSSRGWLVSEMGLTRLEME